MHSIIKKPTISLLNWKVSIFDEELKKMQPPKLTFRSQIGPLIKSYECSMFLLNFRSEITLDWWILKDLNRLFFTILPSPHPLKHTHPTHPRFWLFPNFQNSYPHSKFYNFHAEDVSKYNIPKNDFCNQNMVKNSYLNEYHTEDAFLLSKIKVF